MDFVVSSITSLMHSPSSMIASALPLSKPTFTLGTSGVVGVVGGDEALSTIATVHVYENRRWLGWFNSPGSYHIAKQLEHLAKSRFFDSFSPGVHTDPSKLLNLDVPDGPKFVAAHSGTIMETTSNLASLIMKVCAAWEGKVVEGRKSQSIGVTVVELNRVPESQMRPKHTNAYTPVLASVPIGVSVAACVACGIFEDWYSCSLILLGILANGISCLTIGSGKFMFTHPVAAKGSPPGDGILSLDKEVVVLKGAEGAVNSITRGRFSLSFTSVAKLRCLSWCSALLTIQFLAQLLLIPQGTLFGQIMFATSLGVSWIYNSWLSSLDKEKMQRDILLNNVLEYPVMTKYSLGTRTAMAVFVVLVLQPKEPIRMLNELLPNDTKVWRQWKETIVRRLVNREKLEFADADWELNELTEEERTLLAILYGDAQAAYGGYVQYSASK